MNRRTRATRACTALLAAGLGLTGLVLANGGPFIVKYPGGDPAAKGVLARLDPDLKPGTEKRLRVIKEDLTLFFTLDRSLPRPGEVPPPSKELLRTPKPSDAPALPEVLTSSPLVQVTAVYYIENPTDETVEVDFGFPILRGIYMTPYSMMPRPDVVVRLGDQPVKTDVISNTTIYGLIRQRAADAIAKAIAADPQLARLVENIKATRVAHPQARQASHRPGKSNEAAGQDQQVQAASAINAPPLPQADDAAREAVRRALNEYLVGTLKWPSTRATLLVEFASLDVATPNPTVFPADFSHIWAADEDLRRLGLSNLGPLGAIGEQKATQFFAELAGQLDPQAAATYETIFTAWGGDVRERSVDLFSGRTRPRELTVDPKALGRLPWQLQGSDPTVYARVDYFHPDKALSEAEKASCLSILKNLPVVFTFAPMNLLHYRATFAPRTTQTLTVAYKQYAYADTGKPSSYQLAYVVHPASLWKDFGPINLEIIRPEGVPMRASVSTGKQTIETREVPSESPRPQESKTMRAAVNRTVVTDKTGELLVAVDANAWNSFGRPKVQGKGGEK